MKNKSNHSANKNMNQYLFNFIEEDHPDQYLLNIFAKDKPVGKAKSSQPEWIQQFLF